MVNEREYFTVELTSKIALGIPLDEMGSVVQFETSNICAVPGVADFWYGVANFKGSLLWILDSDRFFETKPDFQKVKPKLTAVAIENQNFSQQKRVAITTRRLQGIMTLEVSDRELPSEEANSQLARCCSGVVQIAEKTVHIIDSAALLQQLHQQSVLVST